LDGALGILALENKVKAKNKDLGGKLVDKGLHWVRRASGTKLGETGMILEPNQEEIKKLPQRKNK
jgi:hypothetical protein